MLLSRTMVSSTRSRTRSSSGSCSSVVAIGAPSGSPSPLKRSRRTTTYESEVRARLLEREKLPDFSPRIPDVGIPDVVTNFEVIEIKRVRDWHHGFGQVLKYHRCAYPELTARLHVFGTDSELSRELARIVTTCQNNVPAVKVTFDVV